jgi:hypothetical protein
VTSLEGTSGVVLVDSIDYITAVVPFMLALTIITVNFTATAAVFEIKPILLMGQTSFSRCFFPHHWAMFVA